MSLSPPGLTTAKQIRKYHDMNNNHGGHVDGGQIVGSTEIGGINSIFERRDIGVHQIRYSDNVKQPHQGDRHGDLVPHGGTRGGFYKHFETKEQLYAHAVRQFLCVDPPEHWQRKHFDLCAGGHTFARMIVNAYLSREHFDDREGSCPVVALPSDVARGGRAVKAAFRQVLNKMVDVFDANLTEPEARQRALALVALCVGAMVVARAVDDPKLGDAFRDAAREHLFANTGWREP